jgi:hypothetical protein
MEKLLHPRLGFGMLVYLIVFALALADAVWAQDWLTTGIFLGLGLLFYAADAFAADRPLDWRAPVGVTPGHDHHDEHDSQPQFPLFLH